MNNNKVIGLLLIVGALGVFIPYTILTIIFEYPDILRQETATVLTKFHAGGASLIGVWWAFAIMGIPLLIAYILIGQKLENKLSFIRTATTLGIISGIAQIIVCYDGSLLSRCWLMTMLLHQMRAQKMLQ